ncbi:Rubredoxin-like zinc ribbon domain [Monaibacterium marinum]|uniref:Rubredoxin-like zinc ribbon domain n=1 Tax=Pontivivens marinum TaxID=1690039 RepID=A0A2C9CPA7_9RHOB|nr:zinc ribbon domain-containing protein [Monaibacterium marinum]SOH92199.1 Rubredoxin-like zinc ribbon domain [Monaibacterium marinum]
MKHHLGLDYTIPVGDLAPYFEALQAGNALASACGKCGHVAFPARAQCGACGATDLRWKPLTGRAQILFRTDAASSSYALVKFDGADSSSTVGLCNPEQKTSSGRLAVPIGDAAGLWLTLTDNKGEEDER